VFSHFDSHHLQEIAMKTAIKTQLNSTASMLAAALLTFICIASGAALAAEPSQSLTKLVHYGDLNLDSEQGAQALYARLRWAARQVCSPLESIEISRQRQWEKCFNNAVANAVGQVDKTTLSALHVQTVNRSKS
jgi:UrcA family protein